jgi:hypothetical protein
MPAGHSPISRITGDVKWHFTFPITALIRHLGQSRSYLQTPHLPPSLAQCRQYLQFLQAWHGSEPVHVAECRVEAAKAQAKANTKQNPAIEKGRDLSMVGSSN